MVGNRTEGDNLVKINFFFSKRNNMAKNRKQGSMEKVTDSFEETIGESKEA